VFKFKRGATFAPTITYTPQEGGLATLVGATITSRIKDKSKQTAVSLVPTIAADGLSFTLAAQGSTRGWTPGMKSWDIKVSIGDVVFYTNTVIFEVVEPETP